MTADLARLAPYGWNARVAALLADRLEGLVPARVVGVTRSTCRVATPVGELIAIADTLPAVGDWVGVDPATDPASVMTVAERWSALTRMDPHGDRLQILAADVDIVLVTCPADRPSVERVERETVLAWDAGARPVVLVTKADLDAEALVATLRERLVGVEVLGTSAHDGAGVDAVARLLAPDRTAVVLGPSGAGKSTLINALLGEERLATAAVRDEDARGRHTTTTRDLVAIPSGGVVIDTPGLRSLGLGADRDVGMASAFADIAVLAEGCRFRDCRHGAEPGCAVRAAVEAGDLDADRFASYSKLAGELVYEERRVDPAAARARREEWKRISKARRDRNKP